VSLAEGGHCACHAMQANKRMSMNDNVIELDESNFRQEVLGGRNPVVVQFWAGWSLTCRDMASLLESVARHRAAPVKVARVNVEDHEALAVEYGVYAVPTLLIFDQGNLQDQIIGRTTEQEVREKLERIQ
jgi:thioredoxin 1